MEENNAKIVYWLTCAIHTLPCIQGTSLQNKHLVIGRFCFSSFKCVWTISTENPEGHVKLTFLEVELYNVFSSSGDFVRVYDGMYSSA